MNNQEMLQAAETLDALQFEYHDGRGIQTVQSIIVRLRQGNLEWARSIYKEDGDKTRMYPKVEEALCAIFGCRCHGQFNCSDRWCRPILQELEKVS
jgi:succinyl-CoA synthetase beta subunit